MDLRPVQSDSSNYHPCLCFCKHRSIRYHPLLNHQLNTHRLGQEMQELWLFFLRQLRLLNNFPVHSIHCLSVPRYCHHYRFLIVHFAWQRCLILINMRLRCWLDESRYPSNFLNRPETRNFHHQWI